MGMDMHWEVPDENGSTREFKDLKEALEFSREVNEKTGEIVPVDPKPAYGVAREDV